LDFRKLLRTVRCDSVVVAVINKYVRDIVIEALNLKKHVLAEKPLGRDAVEARQMVDAARENGVVLKAGFNHRFHPAGWRAKEICGSGEIGRLLTIRARYGHGGRPGMEQEWRASKDLCGGGELLDQGVHVLDLIRWFAGDVSEVCGRVETKFWDIEVEDNAFAILKTSAGVTACFHVSWTNWKNIFSFEVFGADGYVKVEGLGGSYGPETLEWGRRKKEGGKPDVELVEFPPEDVSWSNEWREVLAAVKEKREPIGSGYDGLKANEVIGAIYRSHKEQRTIRLLC
jgi:predicted dehydrogenase